MYPVTNPQITSPYGQARTLPNGKQDVHCGIDFVSGSGDMEVFSILYGTAWYDEDHYEHEKRFSDPKHSAGNWVGLIHFVNGKKYFVKYLHLSENYITNGQEVKEGEIIGKYGDVGYSFGAHLHITCYNEQWQIVDPKILFEGV